MIDKIRIAISEELNISPDAIKIYASSYCEIKGTHMIMVCLNNTKYIACLGNGPIFNSFNGNDYGSVKLCPLIHSNRLLLNEYLDYTRPKAFGRNIPTFGAGDRLGLASPGHIKAISNSKAKPILAQQSKRELDLTGRTYKNVLDDVCFAVFQEGYKDGFGADGDHLKSMEDIADALDSGYTMITLDCSEKIGRGIDTLPPEEAAEKYASIPIYVRERLENEYLNRTYRINDYLISFTKEELIKNVLIYYEAIRYIIEVYNNCISTCSQPIDFEVSIDETESTTSEYGHLFVASEIIQSGVCVTSIAPRFTGEFQKGIDYIGQIDVFESQLKIHAAIADYFGYKLSIHSGSDKFSVFNYIGKHTNGRLHIKTSGTNWLEAVGTIAECNPTLYRAIHKCALNHFEEAKAYYHVSADLSNVPNIDIVPDNDLLKYLQDNNSRQLLHITYGFILNTPSLRESIYETLIQHENDYKERLINHIGRHLEMVCLK